MPLSTLPAYPPGSYSQILPLLEHLPVALAFIDRDSRSFSHANTLLAGLLGHRPDALTGQALSAVVSGFTESGLAAAL